MWSQSVKISLSHAENQNKVVCNFHVVKTVVKPVMDLASNILVSHNLKIYFFIIADRNKTVMNFYKISSKFDEH